MANEKRGRGRPRGSPKIAQNVSFPADVLRRLRDYASWTGQGISDVVVRAVTRYLDNPDRDGKS